MCAFCCFFLCLDFRFGLLDGFGLVGPFGLDPDVDDDGPFEEDLEHEKTQQNRRCHDSQTHLCGLWLLYILDDLQMAIRKHFPQHGIMLPHLIDQPEFKCLLPDHLVRYGFGDCLLDGLEFLFIPRPHTPQSLT